MNGEPRAAWRRPVLQCAVVAALGVLGCCVDLRAGLLAIAVMAAAWPPAVPWSPLPARSVLRSYLPFAIVWLVFLVVYLRAMHALGWTVSPQPTLQDMAQHGLQTPDFVLLCLAIVVVAPLAEEIVFRGYLFTALRTLLPAPATQLLTAAAFGAVHGAHYALPIGVLALLFGWLRARHGSLLPSMLAHAVHNGVTVVVTVGWPGHLDLLYPK
jgi:membrane protease YdiL (CAAX protease family)